MINNKKEIYGNIPIVFIINIIAMFLATSQTRNQVYECYLEKDEMHLLNITAAITFASHIVSKIKRLKEIINKINS